MSRKNYSEEFRRQAVELYESTPGATIRGIAADLGVVRGTLTGWIDQYGTGTKTHVDGTRVNTPSRPHSQVSAHQPGPVEQAFNDRADTYSRSNWHRDYAERLVQIADVTAHTTVIDTCTGTGMAARAIARDDPTIRVVGVDISEKMLDRARNEAARASLTNVRFVRGDAASLSDVITEGDVDLIVCSAGLLYLPITEALSNWSSVLSAGGRVAFSSMAVGNPPAAELFRRLTTDSGIVIDDPSAPLGTPSACREHIERAGLRIVEIHEEQVHFTSADLGSAWAVHERMYTEQLAALSHDARAALEHRFRSELSETVGVDRADVLYCVAQKPS